MYNVYNDVCFAFSFGLFSKSVLAIRIRNICFLVFIKLYKLLINNFSVDQNPWTFNTRFFISFLSGKNKLLKFKFLQDLSKSRIFAISI